MTEQRRGKLKVFMGYAAGVGKTYKMLEEAHALKALGVDIVVGYFESHGRQETIARAAGLETIPRKKLNYRGASFEEMDAESIVARHPQVCIVDELPHTNVPGSARNKRWEDVALLLNAGIDVFTTMNIQHLESLNDQVRNITGITVRETVPDWMIEQADEVVMIDLTPRALLHRLERGVVYSPEQAQRALQNFFREPTLVALRELALREAAHEVERRITNEEPRARVEVEAGEQPLRHQKILVYLTADPKTAMATRRAKRVSDFLRAKCFAVAVQPSGDLSRLAEGERQAVQKHLSFAGNLQIETQILQGENAATALIDFARHHEITQIFVTRPQGRAWPTKSRDPVQQLIARAKDMQIVIVSDREPMTR
jgi:two-component system sensor histidine kinase KdpD